MNPTEPDVLVFERNPVSRLISCAGVFGSAAIFFVYLAEHPEDYRALPIAALIALFLGTVLAMILQYGDHIYVSREEGVKYENRVFKLFGKAGAWMPWDDIVEIREIRDKVLILLSRDGRRLLVDAILGYAIARSEILRRAPHAIVSGTLARDDS